MSSSIVRSDSFNAFDFFAKITIYDNKKNIVQKKIEMAATTVFTAFAISALVLAAPIEISIVSPLIGLASFLHLILCNREKNRLDTQNRHLSQAATL